MTKELIERSRKRHEFTNAALIVTTITLVVSLVIAVTAVSIGIARADTLVPLADSGGGRFALAVLVALVIAGVGGLTAAMARDESHPPPRD
ncbi:MAG TPA: hypothetical protein VIK47_00485 [Kiloniellales bacterium]